MMAGNKRGLGVNLGKELTTNEKKQISISTKKGMECPELRKKLSELKKGKKFYTNGIKTINVLPGTEPKGFVAGRKLKNK